MAYSLLLRGLKVFTKNNKPTTKVSLLFFVNFKRNYIVFN